MKPTLLARLRPILFALSMLLPATLAIGQQGGPAPSTLCPDLPEALQMNDVSGFTMNTIQSLIPTLNAASQMPDSVGWVDKCGLFDCTAAAAAPQVQGIGIQTQVASGHFNVHAPMAELTPVSPATLAARQLFRTAEIPIQVQLGPDTPLVQASTRQLASVYFNCHATKSILAILRNQGFQQTPAPKLEAGSIIVKLIWHIEHTPRGQNLGHLWTSLFTAALENAWSAGQGVQISKPAAPPLPDRQEWQMTKLCADADCGLPHNASAVPLSHIFTTQFPSTQGIVEHRNGVSCFGDCIAELVGVNMMVRPQKDAEWTWITLWWTGTSQHNSLPAPWNYYEVASTSTGRTSTNPTQMNIIFNPYLEGFADANGRVGNCRTCHSYAAVAGRNRPSTDQETLRRTGLGPGYGDLTPERMPDADLAGYQLLFDAASTDMVWSLGAFPQPVPHP